MARLRSVAISNFRSIGSRLEIEFPEGRPVILLGENNAGKSNIVKALQLILGPQYPTSFDPYDHDFFNRMRQGEILVQASFDSSDPLGKFCEVELRHDASEGGTTFLGAYTEDGTPTYRPNSSAREECICTVVEADRNLSYHLGYSSKWTLLSRLMHRFHKALLERPDTTEKLQTLFSDIKKVFAEVSEFTEFVGDLKTQLGEMIGSMTYRLEVDFEAYNPVNFFQALRLQAAEGDEARALEEMGTGEQQILALSFAYAYAKAFHGGILLAVEEPESHLHPLAQDWLARKLTTMSKDGLQLLITTHSASFIDVANLEGFVLTSKGGQGTKVAQITRSDLVKHCVERGAPTGKATETSILPHYSAASTKEILEGLFAKLVVLVEGPTERLSLPIYMRAVGFDTAQRGVAIVSVHGKGNLAKWYRFFTAFGIPSYLMFDNDAKTEDVDGSRRTDALKAVGVGGENEHKTLLGGSDFLIKEKFAIFGSNFEEVLRDSFPNYSSWEKKSREEGVSGKPLTARWVAEKVVSEKGKEKGWAYFETLSSGFESLLTG